MELVVLVLVLVVVVIKVVVVVVLVSSLQFIRCLASGRFAAFSGVAIQLAGH